MSLEKLPLHYCGYEFGLAQHRKVLPTVQRVTRWKDPTNEGAVSLRMRHLAGSSGNLPVVVTA